ncbi:hypothetical protein C0992_005703 [Termitomyces sp. T32_za158]|nr:hypothetical protein C0992_005703 [Termitomyces sp. T32_za158]
MTGGPGGGTDAADRSFFNPEKYKITLFDQRGAGKSTPYEYDSVVINNPIDLFFRSACLEENTTWDLVKDIEKVREELKIDKWHVFGGSWVCSISFLPTNLQITEGPYRVLLFPWHMPK